MTATDPEKIVLENAKDFLNSGLSLLLRKRATAKDLKLAVVSIQTSVELLAKYRLIKEKGLSAILRNATAISGPLLEAAQSGQFRTIGYHECLDKIKEEGEITETDEEVFRQIQNLRNALIHFAANIHVTDTRDSIAWLLVRVLAIFAAGQDRDIGQMQSHRRFLDEKNHSALIAYETYRSESVDVAADNADSEQAFRCWLCRNDSLSLRTSETYYCYCCGLTADREMAAFADCSKCKTEAGICYDALNTTENQHHGRCLFCDSRAWVWQCVDCGRSVVNTELAKSIICESCSE